MLNPVLGRNLGRWAQVYFTTPVERREQAVLELLRELEAEAGVLQAPQAPAAIHEVPKRPVALEPGACAECGHPIVPGQRFCGMCGTGLFPEATAQVQETEAVSPGPASASPAENPPEEIFPTLSFFADVPREPATPPSNGQGKAEVQWLRDASLVPKPRFAMPRISLRYGILGVAVVALGLLFYASSRSAAKRAAAPPVPAVAEEKTETTKTPEPGPAPTAKQPAPSAIVVAKDPDSDPRPVLPAAATAPHSARPAPAPAPPAPVPANHASAVPVAGGGAVELATAQSYLAGKTRPRDSAAAATFLWAAVRKENTTAVLLLSELYLAGDGVPKNCDQARVLLMAAARKQVPAAVTRLRELETSGCP